MRQELKGKEAIEMPFTVSILLILFFE